MYNTFLSSKYSTLHLVGKRKFRFHVLCKYLQWIQKPAPVFDISVLRHTTLRRVVECFTSIRSKHNSSQGEPAIKNRRQADRLCTTQVRHTKATDTYQYVLTCVHCTCSISLIIIRCSELYHFSITSYGGGGGTDSEHLNLIRLF